MSLDTPIPALLERFYARSDEQALDRLIDSARPMVRARLAQKGIAGDDLDDLLLEALGRIVEALRAGCAIEERRIAYFPAYVETVADRIFDDHIRRTRPNWCRVRRRLIYLLDGKGGGALFARWRLGLTWLGGFAHWRDQPFRATARYLEFTGSYRLFKLEGLANPDPAASPVPVLVARLFHWIDTPLEIGELTSHVAALQGLHDSESLSLEAADNVGHGEADYLLPPAPDDIAAQVLNTISDVEFRERLWSIVLELPASQRSALLLNMEADELLLLAPLSDIARSLDIDPADLPELWPKLPLSDREISDRMGITPKQAANLRKCARERIARWLSKPH